MVEDFVSAVEKGNTTLEQLLEMRDQVLARVDSMRVLTNHAERWHGSRESVGIYYYLIGRTKQAVATLRQEARSANARVALGIAAVENQEPEVALEALKGQTGFLADLTRARASVRLGQDEEAEKILLALEKSHADSVDVKLLRADYYSRTGNLEGANVVVTAILKTNPGHRQALFLGALIADRMGYDELSTERYETLAQARPIYAPALINLGVVYEDRGDFEHALRCYKAVLSEYPDDVRARLYAKDAEASLSMYYDEDRERKEDKRLQVLRTPVSDFELSVRSRNCLQKMNIETLGDLISQSEADLLSYKNFGETSLQEIKAILAAKGLRLGMGREEALRTAAIDEALERSKPKHEGVMAESVDALELSVRARKCMERMNVRTIGDLCDLTEQSLLSAPNFGATSLIEVKRKLAELGLSLGA